MAPHVERKKGHYRGGGAPLGNKNALGNKGGTGRPPVYDPVRFPTIARALAADGKLDVDLAQAFKVTAWCIGAWKRKHPEFRAACQVTDEEKIAAVERSLFHRAVGFSHPATKIVATSGGVIQVPYIQHHPPDVAAIKYFLSNRASAEWRDRALEAERGELVVHIEGGLPDKQSITGSADQALLADS